MNKYMLLRLVHVMLILLI